MSALRVAYYTPVNLYSSMFLEGFLFGTISVLCFIVNAPFLLSGLKSPILGVYSGMFALYLHCHAAKEETRTGKTRKIIFYALCVLYLLSVVVFVLDILEFTVSNNELFLYKKEFALIRVQPFQPSSQCYFYIVQTTVFGCCDFIAQSILVRTSCQ